VMIRGRIQLEGAGRGWSQKEPVRPFEGKVGRPVVPDARDEKQECSGDPEGPEAKSGQAASGRSLNTSSEIVFLLMMEAPWSNMRSIRVQGVNTRHSRTLKSSQSSWDQLSKVQPCLANIDSVSENTPSLVHMRSPCKLASGVWTLSSHPP